MGRTKKQMKKHAKRLKAQKSGALSPKDHARIAENKRRREAIEEARNPKPRIHINHVRAPMSEAEMARAVDMDAGVASPEKDPDEIMKDQE